MTPRNSLWDSNTSEFAQPGASRKVGSTGREGLLGSKSVLKFFIEASSRDDTQAQRRLHASSTYQHQASPKRRTGLSYVVIKRYLKAKCKMTFRLLTTEGFTGHKEVKDRLNAANA